MNKFLDPDKILILSMDIILDKEKAESLGIVQVHNASTRKEAWKEIPYSGWSKDLLKNPDNLLLNRLDGEIVISSLIEFADEFSFNYFSLKYIYEDMEGGMASLRKSFLN